MRFSEAENSRRTGRRPLVGLFSVCGAFVDYRAILREDGPHVLSSGDLDKNVLSNRFGERKTGLEFFLEPACPESLSSFFADPPGRAEADRCAEK